MTTTEITDHDLVLALRAALDEVTNPATFHASVTTRVTPRRDTTPRSHAVRWISVAAIAIACAAIVGVLALRHPSNGSPSLGSSGTSDLEIIGQPLPRYSSDSADDPAIHMQAPLIRATSPSGSTIETPTSGRRTLVVFVADWCPHCNNEIPRLVSMGQLGQIPADIDVVAVITARRASTSEADVTKWLTDKGWEWPIVLDRYTGDRSAGTASIAYGQSGYPNLTLVGADQRVVWRHQGELSADQLAAGLTYGHA